MNNENNFVTFEYRYLVFAIIALCCLFFSPSWALASLEYERTPNTTATTTDTSFIVSISVATSSELGFSEPFTSGEWGVQFVKTDETTYFNSECVTYDSVGGDLEFLDSTTLDVGEYGFIGIVGYPTGECGNNALVVYGNDLEYESNATLFEIVVADEDEQGSSTPSELLSNPNWGQHIYQSFILFFLVYFGYLFYFRKP